MPATDGTLDQGCTAADEPEDYGMTNPHKHRASPRRGLLQPIGEAFLYRSPHAPLAETCRLCKANRGRGRHDPR
jgi:hypothetical protein